MPIKARETRFKERFIIVPPRLEPFGDFYDLLPKTGSANAPEKCFRQFGLCRTENVIVSSTEEKRLRHFLRRDEDESIFRL
jgi:hypothetical protein